MNGFTFNVHPDDFSFGATDDTHECVLPCFYKGVLCFTDSRGWGIGVNRTCIGAVVAMDDSFPLAILGDVFLKNCES